MVDGARVWVDRLRSLAEPVLALTAPVDPGAFRDEFGHRRPADGPFLAWRWGREWSGGAGARSADAEMWQAVVGPMADARRVVERARSGARSRLDGGALLPHAGAVSLEVWTESELCALHALRWLAARDAGSFSELVRGCARWHIDHLQPDNATNRPWGVHVFLELGLEERCPSAMQYAQTLLHNCQVALGRADTLSAHVLMDAADALASTPPRAWAGPG